MKLKWFPLDQYARDGYVRPAMILLSLFALTVFGLIVGDFSVSAMPEADLNLLLAASGVPISAHIAQMSKDDDVQELEQIAYQDQLTGLRNRRGLIEDARSFFNEPFSKVNVIVFEFPYIKLNFVKVYSLDQIENICNCIEI